jgi:hypothetical protein
VQPVRGNIGVEARIVNDGRKTKHKEQPQRQRRQARSKKEPRILPHQFEHA